MNVAFVSLNAIVMNSLSKKECAGFSNISVFGVHTENGSFSNALFSNLCVFISVFEKLRFDSGAMSTEGQNEAV